MNGFDIFLIVLIVAAAVAGAMRGFGMAILDLIAVYSALLIVNLAAPSAEKSFPQLAVNQATIANFHVIAYIGVAIVFALFANFSNDLLRWDLGMFNGFGGTVAGIAAGVVIGHALVAGLAIGGNQQVAEISGNFSQQLLTFSSFHQSMDGLASLTGPNSDART